MKNNSLNKEIAALKNIKLSPEEKGLVLSRLTEYVEAHPAQMPLRRGAYFSDLAASLFGNPFALHPGFAMAGLLMMLIVTGGSAAFAAEGALPGDLLYPVKIYVNEPVRGTLAVGNVKKAEWEATRAVRRLEEAETLSTQGRLSTTTAQSIRADFEKSSEAFHTLVQNSETAGTSTEMMRVQSDFESEMHVHAQVLTAFEEERVQEQPEARKTEKTGEHDAYSSDPSEGKALFPKEIIKKTREGGEERAVMIGTTTTPVREDTERNATTTRVLEVEHKSERENTDSEHATTTLLQATSTLSVIQTKKTQETESTEKSGLQVQHIESVEIH